MEKNVTNDDENLIQDIHLRDPYEFVSSQKTLANIIIHGKNTVKKFKIVRTRKGGHLMLI
mgnify:CR=1 FL=1